MNMTGPQVDAMTIAQMFFALEGFNHFHGVTPDAGVDRDQFMRVLAEETAAGRVLN